MEKNVEKEARCQHETSGDVASFIESSGVF